MSVLKDLGNIAIHADGTDVGKQDRQLRELLPDVVVTIVELLDVV